MSGATKLGVRARRDVVAALGAGHGQRLQLQINTSGAWRNVVTFDRSDELACAHVLTAAPLLAGAAGPRVTLRIASDDGKQSVYSHWDAGRGWRGTALAAVAAAHGRMLTPADDGPQQPRVDTWFQPATEEGG